MPMGSHSLEELDRLAGSQLHDRLLPGGPVPEETADPARLARHAHRPDGQHPDVEELLDGAADLVLVGARVDREGDEVLLFATDVALLGHEGAPDHVVGVHGRSLPGAPPPAAAFARSFRRASSRRSSIRATALRVSSRCRCRSTSNTFSPSARITETPGRLRAETSTFGSSASITIRVPPSESPSAFRMATMRFVL